MRQERWSKARARAHSLDCIATTMWSSSLAWGSYPGKNEWVRAAGAHDFRSLERRLGKQSVTSKILLVID